MDLTGYKISFEKTSIGAWNWSATDPEGNAVPKTLSSFGVSMSRENAEEAALKACEFHAQQPEVIDAEDLRKRLNAEPLHRS